MFLRLFIFTLLLSMTVFSQTTPPIETGVSQTLAKWRAANYSDVHYKLNLTLEKGAPTLKGTIEISVKNNADRIILDWRKIRGKENLSTISNVSVNGRFVSLNPNISQLGIIVDFADQSYFENNEHLIFSDGVKPGENVIKLDFTSPILTSGSAITRYVDKEDGAEYVYSLFVPSDASTAFPVFDQPDLKARFKLLVERPNDWKVVSNTVSRSFIGNANSIDTGGGAFFYTEFEETKPISTYVFAFAAGDFAEMSEPPAVAGGLTQVSKNSNSNKNVSKNSDVSDANLKPSATADGSDKRTKIYARKSQAEKFKQHAAEVFRLNRESIKNLEDYFDYKFPFPKYDLVLIPEFPFGGMEHAGATFLRESSIIFPSEPTKNDFVSRANLIFHEAAHQWFGDLVTMKWFDDLWLKEGFAEFMAYKTLEKVMPEYNAWKIFYERNKQAAYLTDSTRGTTPIYQEIPNLSAAKSAYGNIVYRKAPSFLKQAEFYLGADVFQTAARAFLKKHEFKNAEWTDLVKEFETASGQDLKDWANVWVKQKGLPTFRIYFREKDMGSGNFYVEQTGFANDLYWRQKIKFLIIRQPAFTSANEVTFKRKDWQNTPSAIEEVVGSGGRSTPVFPNYQDYGYGIFLLNVVSRNYILENIQNEKDDFLRAMMWGSLWDSVREAELAPRDYVELVIKNISVEQDESTIQTLLARVSTAMNYYLSDAQRATLAPMIENLLLEKMKGAKTIGQKITFYRAFLNISSSENARNVLKQILKGDAESKVRKPSAQVTETFGSQNIYISLKTKDKFDIVSKLLILGDRDAPNLLAELEKSETSDEAKRYAYAAKAGIATAENKARVWNDFINNKEISESWIEAAFAPFNSVRHAELTLPYLEKALAELPNLKRNRKIFFVNGWLGAFIGGQRSEEALKIVNKFLADNPNLDKDLRLKILENVDGLERAVKIRRKFSGSK